MYISTNNIFLDIVHRFVSSKNRPVYFSKHIFSETGFCLRLQVKPTQLGPIDRTSPYLRTKVQTRRYIMSKNVIFVEMEYVYYFCSYECTSRLRLLSSCHFDVLAVRWVELSLPPKFGCYVCSQLPYSSSVFMYMNLGHSRRG
jgi:hypothetical protein